MNATATAQDAFGDVQALAVRLGDEGRVPDAILLWRHLEAVTGGNALILSQLARLLGAAGEPLEALQKLSVLKAITRDAEGLLEEIRQAIPFSIKGFNERLAAGDIEGAGRIASLLAGLVPGNPAMINAAMACHAALGRGAEAVSYARALLRLEPDHAGARAIMESAAEVAVEPVVAAPVPAEPVHPLIQLRDLHDAASRALCGPSSKSTLAEVGRLVEMARALKVEVPAEGDWDGWLKHYRLAIEAIDPALLPPRFPVVPVDEAISFVSASGRKLDWSGVQAHAKKLGAKAVFFAAADRGYVDLYARWYIKSILKFSDVKCLVIVHVIGGSSSLKAVAQSLSIDDPRLVLAGDGFDAAAVATRCYDTPPKGLIAKPVAHFQSVSFLRLGALLDKLKLPVFVSDIDLLLQRGVADLLDRCEGDDIVLNENEGSVHAGSRLTANLLLVNPTPVASQFLRYLRAYLERALGQSEVSRWIDQFGLVMARELLRQHVPSARLGYFDTTSDINNVMYRTYQTNPFRFLSLYHGFDTSSLEDAQVAPAGTVVSLNAKPRGAVKTARKAKPASAPKDSVSRKSRRISR
jgi:tetratricopeptide (TPR) repeat protein